MLTPLEIENRRFKKEVFGYNQIEVEDYLSHVSAEYEKIYKDNNAALARINMLTDAIKQYKTMEETLQNAMSVAQKSGEEIRAEAREAAARILATAEEQAQSIIADAKRTSAEISYKTEEIKKTSELFKKQTIELLTEQMEVIKKRHSFTAPEIESMESFAAPDAEGLPQHAVPSQSDVDLSKVLADVGKISERIENFAAEGNVEQDDIGESAETAAIESEPEAVKVSFESGSEDESL